MAIKIENRTEDDIIITCFGKETEIPDGEDAVFDSDGKFTLTVKRKRIPEMTKAAKKKLPIYEEDATPASHIQLRGEFEIEPNSSKTVVTLTNTARLFDTLHEDAIFVGYKAEVAGGKAVSSREVFSDEKVKKEYKTKQLLNTIFPVGTVGIGLILLGVYCLIFAYGGNPVKLLSNEIDMLYASLMTAAGALVTGVFVSNVIKILKRVKEYS
ncbi:MAG: hypothetical protein IJZ57_09860 [Clostridia bacterium]|nr:hypothetical protein [Clostridia bacterium]